MSEQTDLADILGELREAVDGLSEKVETLEATMENLFNAFDPQCGETLKQLTDAASALVAALANAGSGPR